MKDLYWTVSKRSLTNIVLSKLGCKQCTLVGVKGFYLPSFRKSGISSSQSFRTVSMSPSCLRSANT